jgi:hypothetical protein
MHGIDGGVPGSLLEHRDLPGKYGTAAPDLKPGAT